MLKTVGEFHEYMNQLYAVAVQHGLRQIIVDTGPSPITPQQVLPTWRTPEGELPSGSLIGKSGGNLIYIVKW